ncbi:MAG: hypothetical protein ACYC8W_05260 [Candidatus Tyrphobacter sp.]
MISKFVPVALLAVLAVGSPALAQQYPPAPPDVGGQQQPPPAPGPHRGPQVAPPVTGFHLRGVVSYSVPYFLVLDARGNRISVHLHDGTVILPTGLTLVAGMRVAIDGYWVRRNWTAPAFVADRIVLIR